MTFLELYFEATSINDGPEERVRVALVKFLEEKLNHVGLEILVENIHRDIVVRHAHCDIFVIECKRRGMCLYRNASVYQQIRKYLRRPTPPHHGALFNIDELVFVSHPSHESNPCGVRALNIDELINRILNAKPSAFLAKS